MNEGDKTHFKLEEEYTQCILWNFLYTLVEEFPHLLDEEPMGEYPLNFGEDRYER